MAPSYSRPPSAASREGLVRQCCKVATAPEHGSGHHLGPPGVMNVRMHPLVRAASAVAVISAIGAFEPLKTAPPHAPHAAQAGAPALTQMGCGPRSIPEGDVCVPLPASADALAPANESRGRGERAPKGRELIPRRPDRPADGTALRYPVEGPILFGFDDTLRPEDEASEATLGALDIGSTRGAGVKVVELVGQTKKAEVVGMGELFGRTVVTLHTVSEGGHDRQYLVFHGRLDAFAPDLAPGKELASGDPVGFAGDSGTPGQVHLHLEVRQVRSDLDVRPLELGRLGDQSVSIPCDPRNVFPPRT